MVYSHILVPLSGSEPAENVLPHIKAMALKGLARKVTLIRVVESTSVSPIFPSPVQNNMFINAKVWEATAHQNWANAKLYLQRLVSSLDYGDIAINWEVLPAKGVADSITHYVIDNRVDLIMMATHARRGISGWLWGNIADQVLRSVNVPIFMVRIPESGPSG